MRSVLTGALLALAALAPALPAAAQTESETLARVPELTAFHEVIYPMWHTAYPARDTSALRALWPDIRSHVAAIEQAKLPGILREKQEVWQQGVAQLVAAEAAYGAALEKGSEADLLAAAEGLHSAFERLARTLRPVLPELADFHAVLYRIYHHDLPAKDRKALVARLPALAAEMDTLDHAELPARLAGSQAEFERARAALAARVAEVGKVAPKKDWTRTAQAVEAMHAAYQAVEKVFD